MYKQIINSLKGSNPSRTLVSPVHLEWLANYVKKLGKGKLVECGVARGGCLALLHKANPDLRIIGLDSWVGMPSITEEDDASKCQKWVGSKWGDETDVYKTYEFIKSSPKKPDLDKRMG